jgi:hypothetical protein
MKAERRHELKSNTLAHGLENLPEFGRRYGTKILLAVVAVLTIIVFVRYQARTSREAKEQAAETFAGAISAIGSLDNISDMSDARAAADQRKRVQDEAGRAIQQVIDQSKDPALRADALLARGDLNWKLAAMPELAGAATQPSLKMAESDEDLLEKARAAYEAAAKAEGASPLTVTNARLSLAAIAEQRGKWDEAKLHYEQVQSDPRTATAFQNEAKVRLEDLGDLAKPVFIGGPATKPVTDLPEFGPPAPTTGPTTTTAPATTTTTTTAPAEEGPKPADTPVEAEPAAPAPEAPASEAPAGQPESGTAPAPGAESAPESTPEAAPTPAPEQTKQQ